jgi:hypothetical protein
LGNGEERVCSFTLADMDADRAVDIAALVCSLTDGGGCSLVLDKGKNDSTFLRGQTVRSAQKDKRRAGDTPGPALANAQGTLTASYCTFTVTDVLPAPL